MNTDNIHNPNSLTSLERAVSRNLKSEQMPEFSGYLLEKITSRIKYERAISSLKPKLWAAFGILAVTLVFFGIAADYLVKSFAQSPSYHFLGLAFSDFGMIAANWQDYALSILESLPLGALALTLCAGLASLLVTDFSVHQFSNFRKISSGSRH